ncbi:HCaRG protein-domain-containing protein [Pelagophyceae sp. CCMP2097]|nr:HCaRG protein-domain-containing protein [Pelagophyceae sp. CCMP2097]|mmetsp:Transcript_26987/g.93172  ORF Transcript_26987/g.93172 Transcript_26987/m.93172 type:complete len:199 (+) Transcript_26987:104-700(+)
MCGASREAAALINGVPLKQFPRLAHRIAQRLALGRQAAFFSDAEEAQLRAVLCVADEALRTIVDFIAFVFEQAAYSVQRPDLLEASLLDLGMDAAHAELAAQVWKHEATDYVSHLKDRHLMGPCALHDSSWEVHLNMAESPSTLRKDPTAIFEFDLAPPDAPAGAEHEKLSLECSHAELWDLFQSLQQIQTTIDGLAT